jgi:hypothetical protein
MPLNRFFKLRQNLQFVDQTNKDPTSKDRFWKVRPLFKTIRAHCLSLTLERDLCVDEQMVPFKCRLNVKQYVKNKPNPWTTKNFTICGKSGLLYDFIIYQGATSELDKMEKGVFGLAGAVVSKLRADIRKKCSPIFR